MSPVGWMVKLRPVVHEQISDNYFQCLLSLLMDNESPAQIRPGGPLVQTTPKPRPYLDPTVANVLSALFRCLRKWEP